jgi:hypothetical protein
MSLPPRELSSALHQTIPFHRFLGMQRVGAGGFAVHRQGGPQPRA